MIASFINQSQNQLRD